MMMDNKLPVMCILLALFIVKDVSCRTYRRYQDNASIYSDGALCDMSATKRMLKGLGITSSTECLLKSKKDVASLVSAYLNTDLSRRSSTSSSTVLRKREHFSYFKNPHDVVENNASLYSVDERYGKNIEDELENIVDEDNARQEEQNNKRGAGTYCCSPDCDPFMKNLAWPNPNLITCEE